MAAPSRVRYALRSIAETGERFGDFAPYVAAIDDAGRVFFQAALASGGTDVFGVQGEAPPVSLSGDPAVSVVSHPDAPGGDAFAAYATLSGGRVQALLVLDRGTVRLCADTSPAGAFSAIGPLGPTVNRAGLIVFRADTKAGAAGIFYVGREREPVQIAVADRRPIAAFQGLPLLDDVDAIARVDLVSGEEAIVRIAPDGRITPIAETGASSRFDSLGRFPCLAADGTVAFSARLRDGRWGVFVARRNASPAIALDGSGEFSSIRGALVDDGGRFVFFATPTGGELGVYDEHRAKVLAVGDAHFGGVVTELALNPVSINARGDLAMRIALSSGVQHIVRATRLA